jgi:hypothetical protein
MMHHLLKNDGQGRRAGSAPYAGCSGIEPPMNGSGRAGGSGRRKWFVMLVLSAAFSASAQEALRNSMAGDAAAEAERIQLQSMAYTVKYGDFILQVTPSLAVNWNDNVYLTKTDPESDFILSPVISLNASYPVSTRNLLALSIDFGYNKYLQHDDLSTWYVGSGSALSFDIFIKDFVINFHDRFNYTQDSAQEAAVANTGSYGTFVNTAGLSGTWDLEDVTLTLGYDHQNTESTTGQFDEINGSSEMVVAQAGLKVLPRLTVGVEGSASFMTYEEALLNDNQEYSIGVYGDWHPGSFLSIKPRVGYTIFDTSQTSTVIPGQNLTSWYADLTLTHQATEFLSYSLSIGHEIQPGIESDAIEDSYIRPSATWNIINGVALQSSLFYEHGSEGGGQEASLLESNFDWYGGGLSLSYSPMKRMTISLNYRLTIRSSDVAADEYTQNMVGLQLTYTPQ